MLRTFLSGFFLSSLLLGSALARAGQPEVVPASVIDEARYRYIFICDDSVVGEQVKALSRSLAASEGASPRYIFTMAVKGFSATVPEVAAGRIARSAKVK